MLITPRTYSASQFPGQALANSRTEAGPRFYTFAGWHQSSASKVVTPEMLLVHQVGSVRVGEVVRYTLTYTPAADPILPIPNHLYVRVKNTSAIPLRAAYLHGPYTLYASCHPSIFDPNSRYDHQETDGTPQFEPYLKAGGNWDATIKLPNYGGSYSLAAGQPDSQGPSSVSWVIEIVSQVIFSSSAAVHFELLVTRDAQSLEYFSSSGASAGIGPPGKLQDHWTPETKNQQVTATKGVFSNSISLSVDDTGSLWNSPPFPSTESQAHSTSRTEGVQTPPSLTEDQDSTAERQPSASTPKQSVHLVVVTHGLHSNLGADMLFLKESIDAATEKNRKSKGQEVHGEDSEEQVIVRGFSGNAVRTERGIQYLGKRLAKYVLLMTYPDQPYFPLKGKSKPFPRPFSSRKEQPDNSSELPTSANQDDPFVGDHAYKITSISFIGHSLGGLIQTYAIAYIRKHSPEFFDHIKPVNFIALATPFLGLSNENPMYVRFALDLGLVGRTGQDLGLSWTAPKIRSGWGAIIGGRGDSTKDQNSPDPGSKPLLRILPCGPAHEALQKFQHRTIYSNVVNDGIVPLRTSCLLFLDWRGLDRVEKARRDNGIVGTMAEWGWAELTGANSKSPQIARNEESAGLAYGGASDLDDHETVAIADPSSPSSRQFLGSDQHALYQPHSGKVDDTRENASENVSSGPLSTLLSLFRMKETKPPPRPKHAKIYKRSQTLGSLDTNENPAPSVRGNSLYEGEEGLHTPPRTTFFESAGDLLMPPLPPTEFILDPAARPRTIFHDRIYHPDDVPPPLPAKRRTLTFSPLPNKNSKQTPESPQPSTSSTSHGQPSNPGESGLKVEEKIARAYHRDLTWRKVLVRLEPDAHNNIIVRRMFTNAYGWPVVKHLVDTHFGHAKAAELDDLLQASVERAKSPSIGPTSSGDEVDGQCDRHEDRNIARIDQPELDRVHGIPKSAVDSVLAHESSEAFPAEHESHKTNSTTEQSHLTDVSRQDSARWTDRQVDEDDDCESGLGEENDGFRWPPTL